MSEHPSRWGGSDPKPPDQIEAAAQQAGLGEHCSSYWWSQSWIPVTTAVLFGALAGLGVAARVWTMALLTAIPALVAAGAYVRGRAFARQHSRRLDLFEHGAIVVQNGLAVIRYDNTQVTQRIVHTQRTVGSYTNYTYTLTDLTGANISVNGAGSSKSFSGSGFERPTEWGPKIQDGVTRAQLPAAWATINAGQRLEFGPIWLTAQQVGTRANTWQWSQISEIRVQQGYVKLRADGRWISLTTTAVSSIPNYFVFITLADRLHAAHRTT